MLLICFIWFLKIYIWQNSLRHRILLRLSLFRFYGRISRPRPVAHPVLLIKQLFYIGNAVSPSNFALISQDVHHNGSFQWNHNPTEVHRTPIIMLKSPAETPENFSDVLGIIRDHVSFYHYSDVIVGTMASRITTLTIVYSTVYSGTDQRKHQSSAPLAFVRGFHRWPVNSPKQMASKSENVSIWWRHHGTSANLNSTLTCASMAVKTK